MLELLGTAWDIFNAQFAWFLAFGFLLVALYHLRLWRKDRKRLAELDVTAHPVEPAPDLPLVSLLVPAWNEASNMEACIRSILSLRYPHKELVLCAGGTDGTLEICRKFSGPGVVVLEQLPGEGKQRALQCCFDASHGTVIFLTDADCILEDRVFESTLYPVISEAKPVATGTWRPFDRILTNSLVQFQWSHHLYREVWLPDSPPTLDGRNAALQRQAIDHAQPFADSAPTGTDYVQSRKLAASGYTIWLARGSRVQTEYPEMVGAYWRQLSRWFRTALLMGQRWNDKQMVWVALWSSLSALVLLASIPFLYFRLVLGFWFIAVFNLILNQMRMSDLGRNYQDHNGQLWVEFRSLTIFIPIGWLGLVIGLADSFIPRRRKDW
jgi:cellulose synthase/poly-beta-1,6-N-acetylglucosamine synthase-like glycosyltransferase